MAEPTVIEKRKAEEALEQSVRAHEAGKLLVIHFKSYTDDCGERDCFRCGQVL